MNKGLSVLPIVSTCSLALGLPSVRAGETLLVQNGRPLRALVVIDEYTRRCLAIDVARKMTSADVLERLTALFIHRGAPDHIRSDNGSEFMAEAVQTWL
jgi:transposase InsO family protein